MVALDDYILRARLAPAMYAVAPAMMVVLLAVPWDTFKLPQALASASVGLLLIGASDLARRFGKRVEQDLFRDTGGQPFATTLRYRDYIIDPIAKARYHAWLAAKLQENAPTREDEYSDPRSTDRFYQRCSVHLRSTTRDKGRFNMVYEENVTYGFRRNLLGLKWLALGLDVLVLLVCLLILKGLMPSAFAMNSEMAYTVTAIVAAHMVFFVFAVSRSSVMAASDQYSRQLVFACEILSEDERSHNR